MDLSLLLAPKKMLAWFAGRDVAKPPAPAQPSAEAQFMVDFVNAQPPTFEGNRALKQSFVCRWCLNPVFQFPRSANDYIHLRAVLMIPDRVQDPPICDACFESAVFGFNRHATNIGTRNDGPTNLCLSKLI